MGHQNEVIPTKRHQHSSANNYLCKTKPDAHALSLQCIETTEHAREYDIEEGNARVYLNLSFILGEECGFGKLLNRLPGAPICGDPIEKE